MHRVYAVMVFALLFRWCFWALCFWEIHRVCRVAGGCDTHPAEDAEWGVGELPSRKALCNMGRGSPPKVEGLGFRAYVQGLGFRLWCFGINFQVPLGLGFRVRV